MRPVRALRAVLGALLLAGIAPTAFPAPRESKDAGNEAKWRSETAKEVAAFASWCAQNGARTAGLDALSEARFLDPKAEGVEAAGTALSGLAEDAADATAKADAQRKVSGPRVAKAYERLAGLDLDDHAAPRAARYATAPLRWDPSKGRSGKVARAIEEAFKAKPFTAALLLQRLRQLDPEAGSKFDRAETDLASKDAILLGHPDHPLLAWVSLPRGWQKGRTYPVLVGVEGAGCNFLGYVRGSMAARGARMAIVVTPCGLSNTNELKPETYFFYDPALLEEWNGRRIDFDGPGMEKILALVRARFGGEEKVFVTGFSGGGNYAYWKLLTDPAHVRGASPACANFSGNVTAASPGEDGGPPVLLMTGSNDEHRENVFGQRPGIDGQTDNAESRLREAGFTHVRRLSVVSGHSPLHAEVWKFVDEVLGAK